MNSVGSSSSKVEPLACTPHRKVSKFVFWNQTRVIVLFLSLICLTLVQINSQIFTFTVICMNDLATDHRWKNSTELHWIEKSTEKSVLFAAGAIGAVIGLVPSVPLINRIGVRLTLSFCGLCSTIGTFFLPLAVSLSFYLVVLCRILQGVGITVLLTVLGVIPASWAPISEYSTYLAVLSSAWQLSNVIFMPVSGVLCDSSMGWRSIYYIFGIATGLFFFAFFFFYSDLPKMHTNVSEKELNHISDGKQVSALRESVPYLEICTDRTVLAAWLNYLGGNLGFITILFYGPTYLSEVLHFNVRETGYINAIPYFFSVLFKFSIAKVADKMSILSQKGIYVFWSFTSLVGLCLGYTVMAMTSDRMVAFGAFAFTIVTSGCIIMGVVKCLQMRCQQHAHFAVSVVSFITYCVQFFAPLVVGFMCPENTPEQWSRLFMIIIFVMLATSLPFPWLTTPDAAKFTISSNIDKKVLDKN